MAEPDKAFLVFSDTRNCTFGPKLRLLGKVLDGVGLPVVIIEPVSCAYPKSALPIFKYAVDPIITNGLVRGPVVL
jgi:hypothetical protein